MLHCCTAAVSTSAEVAVAQRRPPRPVSDGVTPARTFPHTVPRPLALTLYQTDRGSAPPPRESGLRWV